MNSFFESRLDSLSKQFEKRARELIVNGPAVCPSTSNSSNLSDGSNAPESSDTSDAGQIATSTGEQDGPRPTLRQPRQGCRGLFQSISP